MKKKEIHIVHTSDIHGQFTKETFSSLGDASGGLAKVTSYLRKLKNEDKIIIDTGDILQGSPFTYYVKQYPDQVHLIAEAMNLSGYDYFVPGNHDFNYGFTYFREFTSHLNAKVLCANLFDGRIKPFLSYDVKIFDSDIKVGVIGLTNHFISIWEPESNIPNITFVNPMDILKMMIDDIKQKHHVDAIIVAYHGGVENDLTTGHALGFQTGENVGYKLFNTCLDIDILLTGHEHRMIMHRDNHRIVSQTGLKANSLSHITLTITKDEKHTQKYVNGKHIDLSKLKEDTQIIYLLKESQHACSAFMDKPIGYSQESLIMNDSIKDRIHPHPMVQLIHDVQKHITGALISVTSLANTVTGCPNEITMSCILNTYVFANTLLLVKLTGKTLKHALEESALLLVKKNNHIDFHQDLYEPKKALYLFNMFDGLHYEIIVNEHAPNTVENITYQGLPLRDDKALTLVMNTYMYATASHDSWIRKTTIIKEFTEDVSEAIIDYVQSKKTLSIKKTMTYIVK